jgi:hypothetical protein
LAACLGCRVSMCCFIFMLNNLSGIYSGRKRWR